DGRAAVTAGIIAGAVAMTRPEGILFSALFPIGVYSRRERRFLPILAYGIAGGTLYTTFLLLRHAYFCPWLPNTFFAKATFPEDLRPFDRLREFIYVICEKWLILLIFLPTCIVGLLLDRTRFIRIVAAAAAIGVIIFCALPVDWMAEFRFASAAIF